LVAVVSSQPRLALLAALLFALATVYYQVIARHRVTATNAKL